MREGKMKKRLPPLDSLFLVKTIYFVVLKIALKI
ncbi:hypothetical protein PAM_475 [Onion yellows phytoplasma OY-M]|uniref:Uncharacterized protein n=1 Tax=Onion yellows phytoplasma (strain OY-M) TaxID=262768 RepID=Q6YQA0_ONYPE|nr:hypothetical protein PAM_475 [Onion yellows phytoplasma OY-M]